jgi:nuclease-like protein
LLRVQSAPTSEAAWETGAADHLAVGPSGVFVIDAKRYKGKIEVRNPFFGDPSLFIAGRNKTKLG